MSLEKPHRPLCSLHTQAKESAVIQSSCTPQRILMAKTQLHLSYVNICTIHLHIFKKTTSYSEIIKNNKERAHIYQD